MKKLLFVLLQLSFACLAHSQDLNFKYSFRRIKEDNHDKTISIPFTLVKATKDYTVTIGIDDETSSATKDKDYTLTTTSPVLLNKDNNYSGKADLVIKADDFTESQEEIHLTFRYKGDDDQDREVKYTIIVADLNDRSEGEPQYTEEEINKLRNLSIEVYAGGNLDFYQGVKFQKVGGEFVVTANSISGKDNRFGGFLGIANFQNFSFDSTNKNVRVQYIRLVDTGTFINGTSRYIQRTFSDYKKLSTNQWSYYVNPTYRLNSRESDFFNIHLSFRLEALKTSTKTAFITDTLSFDTTSRPISNVSVFQAGSGIVLKSAVDEQTSGFFSIGFPMFLNAKGKLKLYFDPNFGVAAYSYTVYQVNAARTAVEKTRNNINRAFYLARLRATEQFSGISITVGGEIRGLLPAYLPTVNAYVGIKANIIKWFSKDSSN